VALARAALAPGEPRAVKDSPSANAELRVLLDELEVAAVRSDCQLVWCAHLERSERRRAMRRIKVDVAAVGRIAASLASSPDAAERDRSAEALDALRARSELPERPGSAWEGWVRSAADPRLHRGDEHMAPPLPRRRR